MQQLLKLLKSYRTAMVVAIVISIFSISCQKSDENQTVIILENYTGSYPIALAMIDTGSIRTVDSLFSAQREKEFKLTLKQPMLFIIKNKDKKIEFIAAPSDSVIVDIEKSQIVKSSDVENIKYTLLISYFERASLKADSLAYEFIKGQTSDTFAIVRQRVTSSFEQMMDSCKEKAIAYIEGNPSSLGIFRAVNYYIKQTPVFTYAVDHKWFHQVDSLLQMHHPNHPYTISFHNRLKALAHNSGYDEYAGRGIKTGEALPEIKLKGLSNKYITISPDNIAMVYLWDHTTRSRRANQALKQLSEELNGEKLSIYAIGFDENYSRWSSVITLDKMWWNNLIDTTGYNSILLKKLNNPPLPYFIIIDKDNKVLSTHFSAAEAKVWLRDYFNKK